MIEARSVWLRYTPNSGWVLRGASLRLAPGSIVALMGPNGSGKTSMLKVLAGLIKPGRGEVLYNGLNIWDMDDARRLEARRTAVYVAEKPVMVRGTVMDNLLLGLRLRGIDPQLAEKRVEWVVESLGLDSILDMNARSLSAGQAQIVSIARALVLGPKYLLLDEPFPHLDRARRRLLAGLLEELRSEGVAIAIAGHEEAYTLRLSDSIAWIESGIVTMQEPDSVLI
ncbi:MAG: ABC transporter ATP-binding protein [Desulfurococcales archaeon]|nr:ABC transporter ATP-binding protein [Desulfurococcales archaeon]